MEFYSLWKWVCFSIFDRFSCCLRLIYWKDGFRVNLVVDLDYSSLGFVLFVFFIVGDEWCIFMFLGGYFLFFVGCILEKCEGQ